MNTPSPSIRHLHRGGPASEPLVGEWKVNYPVKTVGTLNPEQAARLLHGARGGDLSDKWMECEPQALVTMIDYPLGRPVHLGLKASEIDYKGHASLGLFLRRVALEYRKIYRAPFRHRVWGHSLEQLYFERVDVGQAGVVKLHIGS